MSNKNLFRAPHALLLIAIFIVITFLIAQPYSAKAAAFDTPTTTFSTYYGGSGQECLFERCAIAVDGDGYIYIAGTTASTDYPTVSPYATDDADGSGNDIFVTKFQPNGAGVVYSTYIGEGKARGITVDDDGNVYVVGDTIDDDFVTTADAYASCAGGSIDILLFKLSNDGQTLLYSTCIGGDGRDEAHDVALDSNGNMVVVGQSLSDNFPTPNAHQDSRVDSEDIVTFKLSTNGNSSSLAYSTYLGGDGRDYAWGIEIDAENNSYIGGRTGSDDFPVTAGVLQPERFSNAGFDGIVAKFSAVGELRYSTFYNQTSTNEVSDVAIDDNGNVHFLTVNHEVVKLNKTASAIEYKVDVEVYTGVEGEGGLVLDSNNNVYVAGRDNKSNKAVALTAIHKSGRIAYASTIDGSGSDIGQQVALYEHDGEVDLYIVGTTESTDFPVSNPIQNSRSGSQDLFVTNVTGLEAVVDLNFMYLPVIMR